MQRSPADGSALDGQHVHNAVGVSLRWGDRIDVQLLRRDEDARCVLNVIPKLRSRSCLAGGLTAGSSAYITLAVQAPATADNTYQGRQSSIDFDWFIAQ